MSEDIGEVMAGHGDRMHAIGMRHGAHMAVFIARSAAGWAFSMCGDAARQGNALGNLYRLAHEAVELGADPGDVRALIRMALESARVIP